ncbi:hypothetical protein GF367_04305 [Candidatus Woesearchaeota archaeon]|nr:hypothetical protein [Candidatus Woesearchaeota archaeon]
MRRGRPVGSAVRQNVLEILGVLGRGHGYQIYKIYRELFPKVTLRVIYYHLKKGIELGELEIEKIEKERGDYSWGSEAEKIYYKLGPKATVHGDDRVKNYIESQQQR